MSIPVAKGSKVRDSNERPRSGVFYIQNTRMLKSKISVPLTDANKDRSSVVLASSVFCDPTNCSPFHAARFGEKDSYESSKSLSRSYSRR